MVDRVELVSNLYMLVLISVRKLQQTHTCVKIHYNCQGENYDWREKRINEFHGAGGGGGGYGGGGAGPAAPDTNALGVGNGAGGT